MLTVENLVFEYPGVRALNNISFTIPVGSITALVGPNGAGKTTLLRCLAALDEPVSGTIRLDNVDVQENPRRCHQEIGYLSDFFGLYDELTVEQCLHYMAMAHGISSDCCKEAGLVAAGRVGIADRLLHKASSLSRGLRQRLAIAQAIIHEPRMLLLDEPASGLDPEARSSLAGLFLGLRDQGMTLLVSSHILTELEEYSTDMLILQAGEIAGQRKIMSHGPASALMQISLAMPADGLTTALAKFPEVSDIHLDGLNGQFRFAGDAEARSRLLSHLIAYNIPLCAFFETKADMHHEYLSVMKQGRYQGEVRQ